MRTVLLVASLVALAGPARAQSNDELNQVQVLALNNYHHEMIECVVYFNISIEGLKQRGDEETAAAYQRASDVLLERTFVTARMMWEALTEIAAREGRTIHEICSTVDRSRKESTFTSGLRAFILSYFRDAATDEGHRLAGHGADGVGNLARRRSP